MLDSIAIDGIGVEVEKASGFVYFQKALVQVVRLKSGDFECQALSP